MSKRRKERRGSANKMMGKIKRRKKKTKSKGRIRWAKVESDMVMMFRIVINWTYLLSCPGLCLDPDV